MTEEYAKSREHWMNVVVDVLRAQDETQRDELFEDAVALFRHMRIVARFPDDHG